MVINYKNSQRGQVLLLSTLVLSGIIMSVSFFVGYLMMQRLKQSVLTVDSAQAFYLSDSGIELELYRFAKGDLSRACPQFNSNNKKAIQTSIKTNGNLNQGDAALGLEIRSTGCIGEGCRVSRSQIDTSKSLSKARCLDPEEDTQLCISQPPAACN